MWWTLYSPVFDFRTAAVQHRRRTDSFTELNAVEKLWISVLLQSDDFPIDPTRPPLRSRWKVTFQQTPFEISVEVGEFMSFSEWWIGISIDFFKIVVTFYSPQSDDFPSEVSFSPFLWLVLGCIAKELPIDKIFVISYKLRLFHPFITF